MSAHIKVLVQRADGGYYASVDCEAATLVVDVKETAATKLIKNANMGDLSLAFQNIPSVDLDDCATCSEAGIIDKCRLVLKVQTNRGPEENTGA